MKIAAIVTSRYQRIGDTNKEQNIENESQKPNQKQGHLTQIRLSARKPKLNEFIFHYHNHKSIKLKQNKVNP
jgi:hypothetical protein